MKINKLYLIPFFTFLMFLIITIGYNSNLSYFIFHFLLMMLPLLASMIGGLLVGSSSMLLIIIFILMGLPLGFSSERSIDFFRYPIGFFFIGLFIATIFVGLITKKYINSENGISPLKLIITGILGALIVYIIYIMAFSSYYGYYSSEGVQKMIPEILKFGVLPGGISGIIAHMLMPKENNNEENS
ncbi:MAG: hypothetical protein WC162_04285 [Sphaerochaetaceae bacterium]